MAWKPFTLIQVYFLGSGEPEASLRVRNTAGIEKNLTRNFQEMSHAHHVYASIFHMSLNRMDKMDSVNILSCADNTLKGSTSVAITNFLRGEITINILDEEKGKRYIGLHKISLGLQHISETNCSYDALQYVDVLRWM